MKPEDLHAANLLWEYHRLRHTLVPADGILVFGSNDPRVGEHAADLFHQNLAPWILFSGGRGRMTEHWTRTEAEILAEAALSRGVPESAILRETEASNTGENIRFSRKMLEERGITLRRGIVVQKPYMERRTIAALDVQWPDARFLASSPPLDFSSYCTGELTEEWVIDAMLGDFRRILDYPALGFASPQEVPDEVMTAFHQLDQNR